MTSRAPVALGRCLSWLAVALLSSGLARGASVGSAFTYQGQLQNSGTPQNGACDFRFKLFDAATAGSQVGSTQTLSSVNVANGLFTVSIDFGSSAFAGSAGWVETAVTCPSGGSFTTLSPRQAMAPAPNAIFAESAAFASTAAVSTDGSTITGNGTGGSPLAAAVPFHLAGTDPTVATIGAFLMGTAPAISGANTGSGYGVYGLSATGAGVWGEGLGGDGVHGHTTSGPAAGVAGVNSSFGAGVYGESDGGGAGLYGNSVTGDGVYGQTSDNGHSGVAGVNGAIGDGVYGYAAGDSSDFAGNGVHAVGTASCSGTDDCGSGSFALRVEGLSNFTDNVYVGGELNVVGAKNFVTPHPTDASREIVFTALEGPESGTYFRGTTRLVGGYAEVAVPESFRLVSSDSGLTVVATPFGAPATIVCMSRSLDKIVFQGSADVEFDYMVNGIRAGYENNQVIRPNQRFIPRRASDRTLASLPAETVRRLKANGILKEDGTVNDETAHRMGWDKLPSWSTPEPQRNR